MTSQNNKLNDVIRTGKKRLDKRIESIGWALFLIWSGALLIVSDELFPEGSWLIGTGLIICVSMCIRYLYGIRIDGFWAVMGLLALGFGISEFFNISLPVFPAFLVIVGVVIVYKTFLGKSDHKEEFWKLCWKSENNEKT